VKQRIACLFALLLCVTAFAYEDVPDADLAVNQSLQRMIRDVARKMKPFLVHVETVGGAQPVERSAEDEKEPDAPDGEGEPSKRPRIQVPFRETVGSTFHVADGPTTGIVYSADGYVLTSSFNFVRDPALISVTLGDGRRLAADLVARDQVRKLALLKVDATDLPVPEWAPTDDVRIGQWAVALGLGFGGSEPSLSLGIISALNRMAGNAIQTDAKLNPGNYGGPLCDLSGRVLGISVPLGQRPGELAGIEMYDSGVGFALPLSRVEQIAPKLKEGHSFYRGWLGMVVDPKKTDEVAILNTADPSPLRNIGVKPGDKIVEIEGRKIRHFGQLVQALYLIPAGEEVYVTLERKGVAFGVKVTLARNTDLGALPPVEEPLDPAEPNVPADEPGPEAPESEEGDE